METKPFDCPRCGANNEIPEDWDWKEVALTCWYCKESLGLTEKDLDRIVEELELELGDE